MSAIMTRLRCAAADAWLRLFFWQAVHAPAAGRALKPAATAAAWRVAPAMRCATLANAAHLLGPESDARQRTALARAVVGNFYDAVLEFAANQRLSNEALLARLDTVEGEGHYDRARAPGRGAILATAHLGPFETAIAMIAQRERGVHVVFRRDGFAQFERLRSAQHARLGVHEAPVDDGLPTWFRLRDALIADEVVLMQADRVVAGQPGVPLPFFGAPVRFPTGPVKLARVAGAPVVPVFATRAAAGGVRIMIDPPLWPDEFPAPAPGAVDPMQRELVAAIERRVRDHPEQWLCLHEVWPRDAADARGTMALSP